KYTRALKKLFDTYLENNPGIDRKRVYLGGLSNGGYMTQVLILEYPTYFAAAIPVCSAALDRRISDKELRGIRNLPVWYVQSASDKAVFAPSHALATYDRLIKMDAPHVYCSYPRDVQGLLDNTPYVYPGHSSWIYVYNNALAQYINGRAITILEWLAEQRR
ncbi:MAG: prolyl oligopeptidase family serine peptidase, partial [Treponema sp.]|nr:prolyl oligopeptidase family serine peptidase [Treponema sp.]